MALYDPFAAEMIQDPYPVYRVLRDEHPVYFNPDRRFWALSRYDDVLAACGDWRAYSSEGEGVDLDGHGATLMGEGNVVETDPPRHEALRLVLRERFTPRTISALEPAVRERVRALRDELAGEGTYDVSVRLCGRLPAEVVGDLLGVSEDQRLALFDLVRQTAARDPGSAHIPQRALDAGQAARDLLAGVLDARLEAPADDLISTIAHGTVEGEPLSRAQQVGLCHIMLSAGTFSTKNLLTNIFWHLGRDPSLREDVAAHPELAASAVEEVLRYDAPLQNLARTTTRAVDVHGVTIPEGSRVALVFGAANRDERHFAEPDVLDIRRRPGRHFAFGSGIHNCIGAPLARLEARVVLEELIPAVGDFTVEPGHKRADKQNERGFDTLVIRRR